MDKVSIFGYGWLGKPLAKLFSQQNAEVWVSPADSSENAPRFVYPIRFRFTNKVESYPDFMFENPVQIWAIPPRLNKGSLEDYLGYLTFWMSHIPENFKGKLVFISSTSIYPDYETWVNEESPVNGTSTMFYAEKIIQESGFDFLILRLGGLMGGERFPAKYFSGKIVNNSNSPVNYIHQSDAVKFIYEAIKKNLSGIYNLSCPIHPTKKEVVLQDCAQRNVSPPRSFIGGTLNKMVDSSKIIEALNLPFNYPNPLDFPIDPIP